MLLMMVPKLATKRRQIEKIAAESDYLSSTLSGR
jgi:hypothetical protein